MPLTNQQTKPEPLRWLFVAYFDDGHKVEQTADDVSKTKEGGSAFTDVLAYDKAPLVAFELTNAESGEVALVDVQTGNFSINGVPFAAHNQHFDPTAYKLELVYFRETRIESIPGGKITKHYVNRYFMGWKTIVNGKSKQVTIALG